MAKIITSVISKEEFVAEIEKLHQIFTNIDSLYETLRDNIGDCDKLMDVMFSGFDEAVRQLELRLGSDEDICTGWGDVSWFIYEDEWGANGFDICIDGKEYQINNASDLWRVIKKTQED